MKTTVIDTLTFQRQGHDPFIDFLKGFSIVCVILNHCLTTDVMDYTAFFFWGASAVPVFIIIQVFHAYKKGLIHCSVNIRKIWNRVVWPFLLCQLVILLLMFWHQPIHTAQSFLDVAAALARNGGFGPGAYYPWIYVQMAVLIPLFALLLRRLENHPVWMFLVFIILSQGVETICALAHVPDLAYRLLFVRYIFLFYLGYVMATRGFVICWQTLIMATGSLALSTYIAYRLPDCYPWFYPFVNPLCHWFCYLYIAYLLLWLLRKTFDCLPPDGFVCRLCKWAGRYSYELFLLQMIFFIVLWH